MRPCIVLDIGHLVTGHMLVWTLDMRPCIGMTLVTGLGTYVSLDTGHETSV